MCGHFVYAFRSRCNCLSILIIPILQLLFVEKMNRSQILTPGKHIEARIRPWYFDYILSKSIKRSLYSRCRLQRPTPHENQYYRSKWSYPKPHGCTYGLTDGFSAFDTLLTCWQSRTATTPPRKFNTIDRHWRQIIMVRSLNVREKIGQKSILSIESVHSKEHMDALYCNFVNSQINWKSKPLDEWTRDVYLLPWGRSDAEMD